MLALAAVPARASAADGIAPSLRAGALAALDRHRGRLARADVIGIVDFARPSAAPRFHLLDLASGATETLLVAHGKGSDPAHRGWLERFSNAHGSNASCDGAFLTAEAYVGQHGPSMRLDGLEPSNSAARDRAIVVHSAAYVTWDHVRQHGKLGRSLGCFTVPAEDLSQVMTRLGAGRLLYAARA